MVLFILLKQDVGLAKIMRAIHLHVQKRGFHDLISGNATNSRNTRSLY